MGAQKSLHQNFKWYYLSFEYNFKWFRACFSHKSLMWNLASVSDYAIFSRIKFFVCFWRWFGWVNCEGIYCCIIHIAMCPTKFIEKIHVKLFSANCYKRWIEVQSFLRRALKRTFFINTCNKVSLSEQVLVN